MTLMGKVSDDDESIAGGYVGALKSSDDWRLP